MSAPSPIGSAVSADLDRRYKDDAQFQEEYDRLLPFERIARTLITRRAELGLSQADVAARAGLSVPVISRLESGRHEPTVKTLRKVADALDVELVIQPRNATMERVRP